MQGCVQKNQLGWRMHSIKGGLSPSRKKEEKKHERYILALYILWLVLSMLM